MNRVFLGGTCNNSTWREELIPLLEIDYFNPIVEDWTPECKAIEDDEKKNKCNIHLYVITSEMTGVYSIAEIIDSAWDMTKDCYVHVITEGFTDTQLKSLKAVVQLANERGAVIIGNPGLQNVADFLNFM